MTPARLLHLLPAALAATLAGCAPGVTFYEVTRTPIEECDIFPQGAFCDELTPPVVETWTVELRPPRTFVYFDGEVWIAEGVQGPRSVLKRTVATRDPGPCTTITERRLSFDEDGSSFSGELFVENRLEGPPACGETPRGDSHTYELLGASKGTP